MCVANLGIAIAGFPGMPCRHAGSGFPGVGILAVSPAMKRHGSSKNTRSLAARRPRAVEKRRDPVAPQSTRPRGDSLPPIADTPVEANRAGGRARRGFRKLALATLGAAGAATLLTVAIAGMARSPTSAVAADAAQTGFGSAPAMHALVARLEGLEARLAALDATVQRVGLRSTAAEAVSGRVAAIAEQVERLAAEQERPTERFMAAALLLQASITTPRPWLREYQAMVDLAPPGSLSRPAAEVLLSHAARGVPSEAELRERFAVLMPQLIARAPRGETALGSTVAAVRGGLASVGLTTPPPPTDQEQAIAGVAQQLRRGNLAAAVSDAASLDAGMQPLLSGWLAQARARLAVEQAVQETLLRLLSPAARSS